jgi:hypothetical protein
MGTNDVRITVVDSSREAPHYRRDTVDVRAADLFQVIIVRGGTISGRPTVDLLFKDEQGAEYVAMITGGILEGIAAAVRGAT